MCRKAMLGAWAPPIFTYRRMIQALGSLSQDFGGANYPIMKGTPG
jgi:hypothetical protein